MESAMDCAALRWREHPRIMVQRVRSQQWPSVAEAGGGALAIKLSDGHSGAAVEAYWYVSVVYTSILVFRYINP
jgi:hypothetical protein